MNVPQDKYELQRMYTFLNKATCKGCGNPIEWWLTTNKKKIPYDPTPEEKYGKVVAHWATCPKSKEFKKGNTTPATAADAVRPDLQSPERRAHLVSTLRQSLGARAVVAVFDEGATCSWREGVEGEDLRHELITAANHVRKSVQEQGAPTR